jgi:2-polyprenyl-3-methyl-5-hydroxy-6-metoxy-1,4-benzoquinol methylase
MPTSGEESRSPLHLVRNKWEWRSPFNVLRPKWLEIPYGEERRKTPDLLRLSDEELWRDWQEAWHRDAVSDFAHRGWYYALYGNALRGQRVLDVGSGFGLDGITFARKGARVTFLDIAEPNLAVVRRLCEYQQISGVDFFLLEDMRALSRLQGDYDVIWCSGSMHHAPFEIMHEEAGHLLQHLRPTGRWIELSYPKARWERDGQMPFEKWGDKTDGGAPWAEWYDLDKLFARLAPARFDVVLHFPFHNHDFIWFDLLRNPRLEGLADPVFGPAAATTGEESGSRSNTRP